MTKDLRVILEIGIKRRVVAGAMDWPGLDRWGTSEDDALAKLSSYLPRYAGVTKRAGMASAFKRSRTVEVVERVPGSSSTDFTPDGLATHRQAYLDAIRAYNAEGKPARTWPIQFLVRRSAHHVMDHAWEMEDRDLTA